MRLRVLLEPLHGGTYDQIVALARATEDAGFDAFFRSDHFLGVDREATYQPTDSWTTLGGLARDTSRVRLGTLLTAATFRRPGVLATVVATVDQMSGGRVELGLGAAWYEQEHRTLGIPFPSLRERFDRLEEQLTVITGLWDTEPGQAYNFTGRHYQLTNCLNPPRTVQSPHPPIVVGGAGPRRTPALAARFADEFNGAFGSGLRERYARFREACEKIDRDPATARLSYVIPVACGKDKAEVDRRMEVIRSPALRGAAAIGSPQAVLDRLAEVAEDGADTVYFHIYDIDDVDHIRYLGEEVVPHVPA
jgi:F420-dependent oxidoreductase-like protein